jgi:hypothetical protein
MDYGAYERYPAHDLQKRGFRMPDAIGGVGVAGSPQTSDFEEAYPLSRERVDGEDKFLNRLSADVPARCARPLPARRKDMALEMPDSKRAGFLREVLLFVRSQ